MSCERNANKLGRTAGAGAGVAVLNSKFSHAAGSVWTNLTRGVRRSALAAAERLETQQRRLARATAPVTNALLAAIDRPDPDFKPAGAGRDAIGSAAGGVPGSWGYRQARPNGSQASPHDLSVVAGALAVRHSARLVSSLARLALTPLQLGSRLAGNLAGRASRTGQTQTLAYDRRVLCLFNSRRPVAIWRSRLTPVLNRLDAPGLSRLTGRDIRASEGVLFAVQGQTWHRGTTLLDTPDGERTITHLQSLSLPARHYYFDRPLTDEAAVGIALGNPRYQPQSQPGYIGQIGQTEQPLAPVCLWRPCPGLVLTGYNLRVPLLPLLPLWAAAKRQWIHNRLYWPPVAENAGDETRAKPTPIGAHHELRTERE